MGAIFLQAPDNVWGLSLSTCRCAAFSFFLDQRDQ